MHACPLRPTVPHPTPLTCSIVLTIHQPRSSIFLMFDQLCLLSEGRVMYFGTADAATAYFAAVGFECPPLVRAALGWGGAAGRVGLC